MRSVLMSRVTEVMQKAEKLKNHNMDYAYIWTDSRAEYMHYFLTYSRQLTQEVCTNICLVFIKSSFECISNNSKFHLLNGIFHLELICVNLRRSLCTT